MDQTGRPTQPQPSQSRPAGPQDRGPHRPAAPKPAKAEAPAFRGTPQTAPNLLSDPPSGQSSAAWIVLWAVRMWTRHHVVGDVGMGPVLDRFLRLGAADALGYLDGLMHFVVLDRPGRPDFDWRLGPDPTGTERDFLDALAGLQVGDWGPCLAFVDREIGCAAARIAARCVAVEAADSLRDAGLTLRAGVEKVPDRWLARAALRRLLDPLDDL